MGDVPAALIKLGAPQLVGADGRKPVNGAGKGGGLSLGRTVRCRTMLSSRPSRR